MSLADLRTEQQRLLRFLKEPQGFVLYANSIHARYESMVPVAAFDTLAELVAYERSCRLTVSVTTDRPEGETYGGYARSYRSDSLLAEFNQSREDSVRPALPWQVDWQDRQFAPVAQNPPPLTGEPPPYAGQITGQPITWGELVPAELLAASKRTGCHEGTTPESHNGYACSTTCTLFEYKPAPSVEAAP